MNGKEELAVRWTLEDLERAAAYVVRSGLFGVRKPEEAVALMLLAQAEGTHPMRAVQEYHIINGRPALRADAMLARFLAAGGRVEWHELSDRRAEATFSHPQGGTVRIAWTLEDAQRAGLLSKPGGNWDKYPRAMLRARVISEGVRTVFPGVATGVYTPEEVAEMEPIEAKVVRMDKKAPALEEKADLPEAQALPAPKPITGAQARELVELFRDLSLEGPPAREVASRRVERAVGSLKELTYEEAEDLKDYLEGLREALEGLSPEERGERLRVWLAAHERGLPKAEELLDLEAEVLFGEEEE
ncbi:MULTISPECIES: hypothetical protein [Thermus]|uniref:Uncharacterized protein n=1 Tax=Thermus scotoductus TaxID=37636 RepID=A0A430UI50_THESC|nr:MULTISPECIES: hypothetical protein [Thermus]ETN89090.1 hypothetical protein TNMX_03560 [Thermus sp. NMX2.A1]RTI01490.1 hypothetical protein CSW29_04115 [Thermus scotoductus]ULR40158.1 recombinase RecT [Thermus sp. NEB1569]